MTKEYTFYMGSVKLIKELLSIGGWGNEIIDIYNAGKLIETLPDAPDNTPEEMYKTAAITLTDRQFNTVVKAIKFHAEKGIILPSPFAVQLIEAFELIK